MKILRDFDLKPLNTFGISAKARFFVEIRAEAEFKELSSLPEFKENEKLFLGSGSNVLFTKDFSGIVVLNKLTGVEVLHEDNENTLVRAMSGEVWHDLVCFAVERGLWGIENLSLIPGTVGAAPMQNIGAYGAELKNTLESVEAYNVKTGEKRIFARDECGLGYRDSIFKNELKDKYFITAITLRLSKIPKKNLEYKILKNYLTEKNIINPNLKEISEAVCSIRRSKLPDPKVIGNAGSFFKNVFVNEEKQQELLKQYPDMPFFKEGGVVKIPAGWLIEKCGWKGKRVGNTGVHERQALVVVNHGGATGAEIKSLAERIIASVHTKFDLILTPEVNLI
ncbi:UDP-N-acetylenolpyruvoylglucosamine reductase [Candidatus Nomurabacteria bacterium RIFCSPLOWO2_01_FULL_41_21]|uniref:UDP-N-acetylenolpyruvoylglucosamine reductase n=2 Tax=Candidatus Nomuraibacteriota TaxID=1752729 RepID=A0A1F6V3T1_9BACT|nr:MAG: UDP-N-acetylenolpyruvoylglucosamine reductase [Candidatus Nomurabacteria bacterium RIFCSPHIGHO2_01_FULL_40_20]OGI88339.1 MAG: UDP-N-acetylenolpyruvoylglucosamine reductase [Candidatus Nomurabacteria bacterium RIFCSPLOWO2_01_FULL_41_21]